MLKKLITTAVLAMLIFTLAACGTTLAPYDEIG
ncbi:glycine/betaine ABC transporter substrate-binding protein, partial [Listeria monocytogenes]